jgi:hypothetical protein
MEQSLLETLNGVMSAMIDPGSRSGTLYSPNVGGGLHLGPLYAAAHSRFREITAEGNQERITGPFPPGLYEVPTGVRLPFDWESYSNP